MNTTFSKKITGAEALKYQIKQKANLFGGSSLQLCRSHVFNQPYIFKYLLSKFCWNCVGYFLEFLFKYQFGEKIKFLQMEIAMPSTSRILCTKANFDLQLQ